MKYVKTFEIHGNEPLSHENRPTIGKDDKDIASFMGGHHMISITKDNYDKAIKYINILLSPDGEKSILVKVMNDAIDVFNDIVEDLDLDPTGSISYNKYLSKGIGEPGSKWTITTISRK